MCTRTVYSTMEGMFDWSIGGKRSLCGSQAHRLSLNSGAVVSSVHTIKSVVHARRPELQFVPSFYHALSRSAIAKCRRLMPGTYDAIAIPNLLAADLAGLRFQCCKLQLLLPNAHWQ